MRYLLFTLLLLGCGVSVPPLSQQDIISNLTKTCMALQTQDNFNLTGGQRTAQHERLTAYSEDEQISAADIERLSKASLAKKKNSRSITKKVSHYVNHRTRTLEQCPAHHRCPTNKRWRGPCSVLPMKRARTTNPEEWQRRQQEQWDKGRSLVANAN